LEIGLPADGSPADAAWTNTRRASPADVTGAPPVISPAPLVLLVSAALALAGIVAFAIYVMVRYGPVVARIFEETPVFAPLRVPPEEGGEDVRFASGDGVELAGTYYRARTAARLGTVVFCHEYLGDRWTFQPYADGLRDLGFDLFTFDFRNHGDSGVDASYQPLQWVSDLEVRDLRAALEYLRGRPDADPAGVGLFGISRGGGAALCVAADDPTVWAVATDGAFPTRGTMRAYINRWAEIYVRSEWIKRHKPVAMYSFAGWIGRRLSQRRTGRTYPNMERAVARLAPRPWLMIHGERDTYIGPEIARELFAYAGDPKDLWIAPGAKHNRCREADPEGYRRRVETFFLTYAPRRPSSHLPEAEIEVEVSVAPSRRAAPAAGKPAAVAGEVAARVVG
jgi:uncharacterized protein